MMRVLCYHPKVITKPSPLMLFCNDFISFSYFLVDTFYANSDTTLVISYYCICKLSQMNGLKTNSWLSVCFESPSPNINMSNVITTLVLEAARVHSSPFPACISCDTAPSLHCPQLLLLCLLPSLTSFLPFVKSFVINLSSGQFFLS